MKNILTFSFLSVFALGAQAAIVNTYTTTTEVASLSPAISATDLLQTSLTSSSITGFTPVATYAPTLPNGGGLYDGSYNAGAVGFGTAYIDSGTSDPWTVEFIFDLTTNIYGYDLTGLNVYSGWDSGLANQDYTIEVSTYDSADYYTLTSVTQTASNVALVTSIFEDDSGIVATNVDAIRFTHHTASSNGRGSYREIDVLGVASTVPEPSTVALFIGLGALGFVALRRRF